MFSPNEILALDVSKPPKFVHLCDHDDLGPSDLTAGCNVEGDGLAIVLVWGKPTDTGGNDPNFVVIIAYEVEISTDTTFLNVTAFNVREDDFCVNRNYRMVLTSLVKGARHFARVRVKNFLGNSAWNSTPTADGRIFLSLASPPQLQFVGSGGDPDLTAVHTASMKYLPYLNMFFDPSLDLGAGVGKNVSLSDIKKLVYIFDISTSTLFDTGATWKIRWAQDEHALNKKSEMHLKVVANTTIPLEFEIKYFVRVCTETVKGFSNWSLTIPRILLKRPGPTESVNLTVAGPLSLKLVWFAPIDIVHPLSSYLVAIGRQWMNNVYGSIVVQTTAGSPNQPESLKYTSLAHGQVIESLQKGIRYFAHVRARNEAIQSSDEFEHGFGPWSPSTGRCSDGIARPSICGNLGIVAVDVPSTPQPLLFKPVGDGIVLVRWKVPEDTGNGSSAYPLIRYELQFADDGDIICNVEQISVPGHFLEYRAQFAIGDAKFARIRAINDAAVSDWSNLSSATALLPRVPGVPQNVKATNEDMIIVLAYTSPDQTGLGEGLSWPLLS